MKATSKISKNKKANALKNNHPFPEKELKEWLKDRKHWNHDDWLGLLDHLNEKGHSKYTECEEGRTCIGNFLETAREKN